MRIMSIPYSLSRQNSNFCNKLFYNVISNGLPILVK